MFHNILISEMNQQIPIKKIPPFIRKLLDILEDDRNKTTIKFDQEKKLLEITSKKKLERLLPKYFRHRNFQSFSRQLNWYGFVKLRGEKIHIYTNSELEKGTPLSQIKSRRVQDLEGQNEHEDPPVQIGRDQEKNEEHQRPSGKRQIGNIPPICQPFYPNYTQSMPMMMMPPYPWAPAPSFFIPQQFDYRFL